MANVEEPTVFVVDDDEAVLDSLQALLEACGFNVKTFTSAADFLRSGSAAEAGCVLLDLSMPDLDGLTVQESLRSHEIDLPVIIISGRGDVPMAVQAMRAGAVDFVEKPFEEAIILGSIDRALTSRRPTRPAVAPDAEAADSGLPAPEIPTAEDSVSRLTAREREVLEQLVIGRSNKAVAIELGISPRTVEIHRARVMEKMGAHNIAHLVRLALASGIDP